MNTFKDGLEPQQETDCVFKTSSRICADVWAFQVSTHLSWHHHKLCLASKGHHWGFQEACNQVSIQSTGTFSDSYDVLPRKGDVVFQPSDACCNVDWLRLGTLPPADRRSQHHTCCQTRRSNQTCSIRCIFKKEQSHLNLGGAAVVKDVASSRQQGSRSSWRAVRLRWSRAFMSLLLSNAP